MYEFILKLVGDEFSEDMADKLFEAGCNDALLNANSTGIYLDFCRESGSLQDAIASALLDIKKAGHIVEGIMEEDNIVFKDGWEEIIKSTNEKHPKECQVNHPKHYTAHPSGIEVIQITEHMNFCKGNAVKYIMRAGLKDKTKEVEDLKKAVWYLNREIKLLEGE